MDAPRQMLMLSKNIDVASSNKPQTLYSKLMDSSGFRIPKKKKKANAEPKGNEISVTYL